MGGSSALQLEQRIGPRYSNCSIAGCRQVRQRRVPRGGATGTLVSGLGDWPGNSSNQNGISPQGTPPCSANSAHGTPSSTNSAGNLGAMACSGLQIATSASYLPMKLVAIAGERSCSGQNEFERLMGLGGLLSRGLLSLVRVHSCQDRCLAKSIASPAPSRGQVLRRGLSALVTQQIADPSQRQALTVKLQGVGMSQAMAVDALCDVCSTGQTREQVAHVVLAHLAAVECADQRLAIRDAELSPSLIQAKTIAAPPGSIPTTRCKSPLPCWTRTVPESKSMSLVRSASTSEMRSPDRQAKTTSARFRSPVGARPEQARISRSISSAVNTSASRRRDFAATAKIHLQIR